MSSSSVIHHNQSTDSSLFAFIISEEDAFRMILDLFAAGTETTSTTLQWFFIYMMYNQEVQEKCRKEIQEVGKTGYDCPYNYT